MTVHTCSQDAAALLSVPSVYLLDVPNKSLYENEWKILPGAGTRFAVDRFYMLGTSGGLIEGEDTNSTIHALASASDALTRQGNHEA